MASTGRTKATPKQRELCPICEKDASKRAEPKVAPFCSERCQLADLGRWLDEDYSIPGGPNYGEFEE